MITLKLRVYEVRHTAKRVEVILSLPEAVHPLTFECVSIPAADDQWRWFQERIGKVIALRPEDT